MLLYLTTIMNSSVYIFLAFFFGFEQEEYVYNERRDEGLHEIIFSPAPGNRTERNFVFGLNLNALQGAFTFGST